MKVDTHIAPAAVILAPLNLVQSGVREIQFFSAVVYSQAIRGFDVCADDHQHVGTGQCGAHDAGRLLVPVGPEHQAAG